MRGAAPVSGAAPTTMRGAGQPLSFPHELGDQWTLTDSSHDCQETGEESFQESGKEAGQEGRSQEVSSWHREHGAEEEIGAMNLKEARAAYYEFSGKTSDLVRTLALSAIAIIWVFRVETPDGPGLPRSLLTAGLLAVASISCDLLHYVGATVVWGSYSRKLEKGGQSDDAELVAPAWLNWPGIFFFTAKVAFLVGTYAVLLGHLYYSLDG
jgi:hypothetical protein